MKLHHFESVHDQLFAAGSHQLNAFERKYGLGGPIPEGLTNYLDVKHTDDYDLTSIEGFSYLGTILRRYWYWHTSSNISRSIRVSTFDLFL